jgi:uncharacterized protein (TIGR03435 family)
MKNAIPQSLAFRKKILLAMMGTLAVCGPIVVGSLKAQQTRTQSTSAQILTPEQLENLRTASLQRSSEVQREAAFDFSDGVTFRAHSASIKSLAAYAYESWNVDIGAELQESQIVGGPEWTSSDRFEIAYRVDDPTIRDSRSFAALGKRMLQRLLADRFQLKFHWEVRDTSRMVLIVVPDGHKLGTTTEWNWPTVLVAPRGLGPHNFICMPHEENGTRMIGILSTGTPISKLVGCLSTQLRTAIIDETGLNGSYVFKVMGTLPASTTATDASVFEALRDQLGLRLMSRRLPTDVMVIDSAARPIP